MDTQTVSETPVQRVSAVLGEFATEVMRTSADSIMRLARQHDISMPRAMTLMYVHRSGAVSVSAVGEYLGLSLGAASQQVDQMVCAGLVTRTEDPADRRTKLVALTPQGVAFVEELRQIRVAELAQRLAVLPEPQLESMLTTIEELMVVLRAQTAQTVH